MRLDGVHIAGLGTWFPPAVTIAEAVENGWYDRQTAERNDLKSVTVTDELPADLAVRAAKTAIDRSPYQPADIAMLAYATVNHQGLEFWNVASYVQRMALTERAFAVEVRQLSNGGMAAMELAAAYLMANPARRAAMVATADRYAMPGFDRWRADSGLVAGDAGTAAVLSVERGLLRVHSLVTVSDPMLEGLFRGNEAPTESPALDQMPVDLDRRQREFIAEVGLDEVLRRLTDGANRAAEEALADADTVMDEILRVVTPNLGRPLMERRYLEPFKIDFHRTTWEWGRTVGHLGAGDQLAGVDHLIRSRAVCQGDRLLLMGLGAGYVWTCAVLEVADDPARTAA